MDKTERTPDSFQPTPLPFSADETQSVQQQTGGRVFQNRAATAAHFLEQTQHSELLHIAAHGIFDDQNPMLSGLLFSKNSVEDTLPNLLTVAGMYGLRTDAAFVYLSACNTGKGQLLGGEGVMSFARALTYAGVRSQVMSLWNVGDRSTGQIATHFYYHLQKGKPKDEALRLAKLAYLSECPTAIGQHPFFWSGTMVFGNEDPLFIDFYWKFGVLAAAVLLLVAGVGYRLRSLVPHLVNRAIEIINGLSAGLMR